MKIPFLKSQKNTRASRREIAASRQAKLANEGRELDSSYRRNKNLNTVSTASPVETSHRIDMHRLTMHRRRLSIRLAWIGLASGIVLFLLLQLVVKVSILTPSAVSAKEASKYAGILQDYLDARPLERLRFMLNYSSLHSFFLENAPEVKNIRLDGAGIASATVKLTFRSPVVQWSSRNKDYFVDDNGVTFEKVFTEPPKLRVKDKSGIPATAGQEVINRRFLSFIGQIIRDFRDNNLAVSEVILPKDTVRQVAIVLEGRKYRIKMTTDREAEAQVSQAIKAIDYISRRRLSPSYIDVRVDQRVFYR